MTQSMRRRSLRICTEREVILDINRQYLEKEPDTGKNEQGGK